MIDITRISLYIGAGTVSLRLFFPFFYTKMFSIFLYLSISTFKVLDCLHGYEVQAFLDGWDQLTEQLDSLSVHR